MIKWIAGIALTVVVGVGIALGLPSTQSKTLCWDAPTTNTDGSPLIDLAGYKVYWSSTSGTYTEALSKDVGMGVPSGVGACYTITSTLNGKYFFVVTAYNVSRFESAFSSEISQTFGSWLRSVTNLRWQ